MNKSHLNDGVIDLRISALEKADEKIETRVQTAEGNIVKIELEIKDLKMIRQIVYGLVGLALLSVWDKLPL